MLARVLASANVGMEGQLVEVECDMSSGLPGLVVVGLANKAVDEARDRVRSAIKNSNLMLPPRRITLNLAPANIPKEGAGYDLAMAVAILTVSEQLPAPTGYLFTGELALDGGLRAVPGVLGSAQLARRHQLKLVVPAANRQEAALLSGVTTYAVESLQQLFEHLNGQQPLSPIPHRRPKTRAASGDLPDFNSIYGQDEAKQALLIAAAGGHNILLTGPPGAGKTMLSRATAALLPPPSPTEMLEISQLHSLAHQTEGHIDHRPFRAPHHNASHSALIGGGKQPRPGEISLSHHGILFLDELPEFSRDSLEALRQPMEDGVVTIARAAGVATYPARFMLIAAQNPCPCGYSTDPTHSCRCTPGQIDRYHHQISGPLLDRLDLAVHVRRLQDEQLTRRLTGSTTSQLAKRVQLARARQRRRYKSGQTNAWMTNQQIERYCQLDQETQALLGQSLRNLGLSGRGYLRILKVARTIADLAERDQLVKRDLTEAIHYRPTV
jgi:magnesium chelatase family protein